MKKINQFICFNYLYVYLAIDSPVFMEVCIKKLRHF